MMISPAHEQITQLLATVRRRWRLRRVLHGLTRFAVAAGVILLLAVLVMNNWHFAPAIVVAVRFASYLLLAAALAFFVGPALVQRVSRTRLALYVEEHEPSLAMALASAAELKQPGDQVPSPTSLEDGLMQQALAVCRALKDGRRVDQHRLHRAAAHLAVAVASLALLLIVLPFNLQHGIKLLLLPTNSVLAASPYRLAVDPGDVRVSQGDDQLIVARVEGFAPDAVELISRFGQEGAWRRAPMTAGARAQAFETFLFDLRQSGEYYIVAGGLRSPVYSIDVAELPSVQRVDLTYHYPAHTHLPPRQVVGNGDISAVRGSRVDIRITPSINVTGGNLVLDGREPLTLAKRADETLTTSIELERDGHYRIDLAYGDGLLVAASPNYAIEVLPDGAPSVRISTPAHDTRVTSVEEPVIEVKAADDLGLGSVELLYAINGGPEQTVSLHGGDRRPQELTADHTLFLEDLGLRPGDLIAYYARARDSASAGGQQVATDLYFMEVRPFERTFRQGQAGGAGRMGGGAERSLSAQQRRLVIATFNFVRDRESYNEERFGGTVELLLRSQERIRDRVEAIIRRLLNRSIIQLQEGYQRMAEELPRAVEAMHGAEAALSERQPQEALAPAREALRHLQRAEAAFGDVNVARAGAAGGGNPATDAEDLANLFKLEMDKLRNQYENVQRAQPPSPAQELDKTLEQLRALARRQQQEIDRLRRRADLGLSASGDTGSQRALAEELEKVVRQLQRLTRERPTPELQATLRQAQQAAEAMRRAAGSRSKAGLADAQAALERLHEAQRVADQGRHEQLRSGVAEALQRARRLATEQDDIIGDVRALPEEAKARAAGVLRLQERKWQMGEETRELETQLERLAANAREQHQAGERALRDATRSMRKRRLPERIEGSASALEDLRPEDSQRLESEIGADLNKLSADIAVAADAIEESDPRQAHNLQRMRELVRGLESLQERIARRAGGSRRSGTGASSAGANGRPPSSQGGAAGGLLDGEAIAQFQREFTGRRAELQALATDLDRSRHGAQDIGELVAKLRELEQAGIYQDPQALLQRQAQLIAALKQIEFRLREDANKTGPRAPLLTGNDEVPMEFRSLVEEYFRDLSRTDAR